MTRVRIDIGDMVTDFVISDEQTGRGQRDYIREHRREWLQADPEETTAKYRDGELSELDLVRRYGVILDWGTGEVLEDTTEQYRSMLERRAVTGWKD